MAARLVVFVILTACRSIEAREAVWSEFDLTKGIWTIPKERMKAAVNILFHYRPARWKSLLNYQKTVLVNLCFVTLVTVNHILLMPRALY